MQRIHLTIYSLFFILIGYSQQLDTITAIFSIINVEIQPDSTYKITIDAGSDEGVYAQKNATVLTRYYRDDDGVMEGRDENTDNQILGSINFNTITNNTSEGIFAYKSGKGAVEVRQTDLVYTKIVIPKNTYRGLLYEMAKLNVYLNETPDMANRANMVRLYNWDTVKSIKNYAQELSKIQRYKSVIHKTREAYGDEVEDYKVMLTRITGGKFAGSKMYELLEQTAAFDVIQFLEFIKEYPYKYMGIVYPLDETYATWAHSNTPLTDNIESSLTKHIQLLLATKQLTENIDEYGFYLKTGVRDKNTWADQYILTDTLYPSNELLTVADYLGLDTLSNYIKLNKANILRSMQNNQEALALITDVIDDQQEKSNEVNAYWYRSFVNQDLDRYEAAIADLDSVIERIDYSGAHGSKGWVLLKTGRWKEARGPIAKAYQSDTSQFSWAINLGHMHLTMGNHDSAQYFYQKSLDVASSVEDLEGGVSDFDLFLKNGWYEEACKKYKDFFVWNIDSNGYLEKAKAESFFTRAYAESDLDTRLDLLDSALFYQKLVPNKNHHRNRLINRWYGYTYYKLKQYPESLKWYTKALLINTAHLKEDDLLYDDYDDLETLAGLADDEELENWYGELKDGIKHKINISSTNSALYVFSCGSFNNEYEHSLTDAQKIVNALTDSANRQFADARKKVLRSNSTRQFESSLEEFISTAKEQDVFVFYFSGKSFSTESKSGIIVNGDSVLVDDLITSLTFIPTKNILIVLDADNIRFIEEYVSYRSSLLFNESETNIQILTPNKLRYEVDSLNHGVLTYALLQALEEQAEMSSFDLKQRAENVLEKRGYYFNFASYSGGYPFPIITRKIQEKDDNPKKLRGVGVDIEQEEAEIKGEGHYALVVGVNDYMHWSPLKNPINDATAIHKRLQSVYGVKSTLLLDPELDELEAALRSLKKLNAASIIIFYAGHGYFEEETERGYLVLNNTRLPQDDQSKATYFDHNRLVGLLNNFNCKNILLLVDACFSGTIEKERAAQGEGTCLDNTRAGYVSDVYQDAPNKVYLKRHLSCPTMKYITSGGKEYVPDGSADHSPFATKLIEALDTKGGYDNDGILSYSEIRVSLQKVTPQPRFGRFGQDNASTEFLLISN